ncbi:MAG: hypothetical protein CMF61_05555 [Magnetococcales bacterium]|nr:hypothetical protein [Magnetococcales bacterium]
MKALSVFFMALLLPFMATAQESCEPELSYKYLTHKGVQYELKNIHGILHGLMAGFYKDEQGNTIIATVVTRDLQCNPIDWECWFMAKGLPEIKHENMTRFETGQVCIQVTFEKGKPVVCEDNPQSEVMADLKEDFTKHWEVNYAAQREKLLMDSYAKYIEIQGEARLSLASYFNHVTERISSLEIEVSDLITENEALKKKLKDK